ncbi:hypothetical protein [Rudaeicoccus suwonensis]|uniref:Uncharacterized protein n=1 Tax=Rudaeicoccus suwonensis TaxID=657409 RepID=A0A561EBU2_9MICO|nr:hypothetical protein [Rudaeicoccus suwonensis]TWE13076.1 hypothetical protein BKA23_1904 [Rudaeicoccus suwonensis]
MPASRRRLIVVLTVVGVVVLATVGVGVYGLVRGPAHPNHTTTRHGGSSPSGTQNPSSVAGPVPATLPKTDNPVVYAKAVAFALFDWSTITGYAPSDYTAPVLADADPSGDEIPGLVGDVASYEPTTDEWTELATMKVIEHLTIASATVPSLWPEALAEAHGQVRPGTTAITITGTLHRTGVWYGQPASTTDPVSFTIFEACSPAWPDCHTLRLSQLNDPLG